MKRIKLSHGAGGEAMQKMIKEVILGNLRYSPEDIEVPLTALDDSSVINDTVFTIDGHTVKPLFFPGGDIGVLSVAGTVNDIAVMGAEPVALSLSLIVEEGFSMEELDRIMASIGKTSEKAKVPVITGDTKVVEKGGVDELVTTTAAFGIRSEALEHNISVVKEYRPFVERWMRDSNLRNGDVIISSGTLGDHGISLLSFREGYGFDSEIKSDVAPLNEMIRKALMVGGIVAMKDPTRGGLANTLNEWAEKSGVRITVEEDALPMREGVMSGSELLGIDPLEVGNEGKVIIGVVKEMADEVLQILKRTEEGEEAAIIGEVTGDGKEVILHTTVGGKRILEPPISDPVPRIC